MKDEMTRKAIMEIAEDIFAYVRRVRSDDAGFHVCHELAQHIFEGKIKSIQSKGKV